MSNIYLPKSDEVQELGTIMYRSIYPGGAVIPDGWRVVGLRAPKPGEYFIPCSPEEIPKSPAQNHSYWASYNPRVIIQQVDEIREVYGPPFSKDNLPVINVKGFEYTGEFREVQKGEFYLTYGLNCYVVRESVAPIPGKRLLVRPKMVKQVVFTEISVTEAREGVDYFSIRNSGMTPIPTHATTTHWTQWPKPTYTFYRREEREVPAT